VSNIILKDKNTCILSEGRLGLPSIEYYNGTAPGKTRTLLHYTELCQKLSKLLDINDLTLGIDVETLFITDLEMSKYDTPEIMSLTALSKKYKNISWDIIFKTMGVKDTLLLRIDSPKWVAFINRQFEVLKIDQWISLFSLHIVLYSIPFLPPPYDDLHFTLFGKFILGEKHKMPQKEVTYWILTEKMTSQLSYIFVKNYLSQTFKNDCIDFVKSICASAKNRIREIKWFEEKTKSAAVEKIGNIGLSIAYPDYKEAPAVPALLETNLLQNIFLLGECNTQQIISINGKKADFSADWSEAVFSANAYYYNESNQIVIPAAMFAWPFYLPTARESSEIAWNYGGLGAAIAHEITHAFDTDGRLYNENGKKEDWWCRGDNSKYKMRSNNLVRLFNKARVEKIHIDGELTLNENIADLGGLAIALDALKRAVNIEKNRKDILKNFFISYAVSWRKKIAKQKLRQSLFLDKHAPTNLRVNLIVSQFDEWYEAFDVLESNKLYIAPEKRIRIF
jgi:putative endopeptidase